MFSPSFLPVAGIKVIIKIFSLDLTIAMDNNINIVAGIFARGGSKGISQKNLQILSGKPLVAHAVETASACPEVSKVFISTDNPAIAETAKQYGAEVPFMRPPELSTDTASEILAWRHALNHYDKEV